jgi:hypothetical protein
VDAARGSDPRTVRLTFVDEARFGRINRPVACWAPRRMRPEVGSQTVREFVYAVSGVCPTDGSIDSLIMPTMQTQCFQLFVDYVSACHPDELNVLVCDGAASHDPRFLDMPDNVRIITLPPYSPQLNPVEQVWDLLRERHFANRVFGSLDEVEAALTDALLDLDDDPITLQMLTGYDWILKPLS